MSGYYAQIDRMVAAEELPEEVRNDTCEIYCYDCERKSTTAFHFVYLRCNASPSCRSYNTVLIRRIPHDPQQRAPAATQASASGPVDGHDSEEIDPNDPPSEVSNQMPREIAEFLEDPPRETQG